MQDLLNQAATLAELQKQATPGPWAPGTTGRHNPTGNVWRESYNSAQVAICKLNPGPDSTFIAAAGSFDFAALHTLLAATPPAALAASGGLQVGEGFDTMMTRMDLSVGSADEELVTVPDYQAYVQLVQKAWEPLITAYTAAWAAAPASVTSPQEPAGKKLIAAERQRQINIEGWTREHDDAHKPMELEQAGEYYRALPESRPYMNWPWERQWFKPTPDDRVRELVKAGALFQAAADSAYRKDYKYDCELLEGKVEAVALAIDTLIASRAALTKPTEATASTSIGEVAGGSSQVDLFELGEPDFIDDDARFDCQPNSTTPCVLIVGQEAIDKHAAASAVGGPAKPFDPVGEVKEWLESIKPVLDKINEHNGTSWGAVLEKEHADELRGFAEFAHAFLEARVLEKSAASPLVERPAGGEEEEDASISGLSYCMGVDLEGLLINGKKSYKGLVSDDNDNVLSPRDTRAWILDQIRKGRWVVPMGECENWNYTKGRCMGHAPASTDEN
ncbi:MAG: hypothetical protein ACRYFZ_09695 [Janthinobacterium lividum]